MGRPAWCRCHPMESAHDRSIPCVPVAEPADPRPDDAPPLCALGGCGLPFDHPWHVVDHEPSHSPMPRCHPFQPPADPLPVSPPPNPSQTPDDAPPLTGWTPDSWRAVARHALIRSGWSEHNADESLAAIERAARADAEAVVSDYPRVMAERDGWRRDAYALAGALRFHNETPAGAKRQCLPECIACDALERHEAMASRAALAPRGGGS